MTTTVFMNGRSQAVRIPREFRILGNRASISRRGVGLLIEPLGEEAWPRDFFENIKISDSAFERPLQGKMPPVPRI